MSATRHISTLFVAAAATVAAIGFGCQWPMGSTANATPGASGSELTAPEATPAEEGAVAQLVPADGDPSDDFAVHEWGLIRYVDGNVELATSGHEWRPAPPTIEEPQAVPQVRPDRPVVRKPLIYFHPGPSFDPDTAISANIAVTGGSLRELWPTLGGGAQPDVVTTGGSYTWHQVHIEPNTPCGGELAPQLSDDACTSLNDGGVCEAAEMRAYLDAAPHCLSVGGIRSPVLLYNGFAPTHTAPVTADGGQVVNHTAFPVGPLWVQLADGIARIDEVSAGGEVSAPPATLTTLQQVRADIGAALEELGLTEDETRHFVGAWEPDVLAEPYPWRAFGVFSEEAVDAAYPLTIEPTPTDVVRVLAFSVEDSLD